MESAALFSFKKGTFAAKNWQEFSLHVFWYYCLKGLCHDTSLYCLMPIQSHSMGRPGGGEEGGVDPSIILTGTFNLVSGHALHAAKYTS